MSRDPYWVSWVGGWRHTLGTLGGRSEVRTGSLGWAVRDTYWVSWVDGRRHTLGVLGGRSKTRTRSLGWTVGDVHWVSWMGGRRHALRFGWTGNDRNVRNGEHLRQERGGSLGLGRAGNPCRRLDGETPLTDRTPVPLKGHPERRLQWSKRGNCEP